VTLKRASGPNAAVQLEILAGLVEADHPVTHSARLWDLLRWSACGQHRELNGKAFDSRVWLAPLSGAMKKTTPSCSDLRHGLGNHLSNWPNTAPVAGGPAAGIPPSSRIDLDLFSIEDEAGAGLVSGIPARPPSPA